MFVASSQRQQNYLPLQVDEKQRLVDYAERRTRLTPTKSIPADAGVYRDREDILRQRRGTRLGMRTPGPQKWIATLKSRPWLWVEVAEADEIDVGGEAETKEGPALPTVDSD